MNAVRSLVKIALGMGLLGLMLGGCATSPPAQYYTLAPLQPPGVKAASVPTFTVAVGPVINSGPAPAAADRHPHERPPDQLFGFSQMGGNAGR